LVRRFVPAHQCWGVIKLIEWTSLTFTARVQLLAGAVTRLAVFLQQPLLRTQPVRRNDAFVLFFAREI
jgi:hypothetical protein